MMGGSGRLALAGVVLLAAGLAGPAAQAQSDYPNRPVRLIVGFPPGSSADIAARVVGNRMTQLLGQQVVVESKPGAASSIAAAEVARAEKDGYTLFMLSSANIINEQINPKLTFNIAKDFAPVAMVNTTAIILAVHPSLGLNDVKGLVALAKSKPGELNYASTGPGTVPHLAGELLGARAGIKIQHVPYKGSPEAATDLLAGRVSMMFSPASAVIAQAKEGKLKLLATATGQRLAVLPDLPTMAEAGMPDFETSIWFGLVAPAGTPRSVIDKLAKAAGEATAASEVAKAWEPQGILPLKGGPDDLARYITSETRRWGEAASAAGLKK
jgi:tripartite-type tricarboxylate transporter receptor subunit TctC